MILDEGVTECKASDLVTLNEWFQAWGMPVMPAWAFSDTGFIVHGMAAGFLYLTNSGMAHIDFYVSNPKSDPVIRSYALDAITTRIIETARSKSVKVLNCSTKIHQVMSRAKYFGFKESGSHECFYREV